MNKRKENTQMGQSLLSVLHERFARAASKDIVVTSYNLSGITPDLPHGDVLGELAGLMLDGAISMMETKGSDDRWMSFNAILFKGELKLECHCGMGFDEKNPARFYQLDRLRESVAGIGGCLEWDEWGDTLGVSVCLPCGRDMESIEAEKKEPGVVLRLRHDLSLSNIHNTAGESSILLLVDGDADIRKMNRNILELEGYRVLEAATLAEGRMLLGNENPDLIILEALMPDGSGLDFCREMRAAQRRYIPVLFLTTLDSKDDVMACLKAGGDDHITKPHDLDVMVARVNARLRHEQRMEKQNGM